ncbi:MAG TPA: hypothetical protein VGH89_18240 [Pseudonocardia sp.]|jgi:hypothetical protein
MQLFGEILVATGLVVLLVEVVVLIRLNAMARRLGTKTREAATRIDGLPADLVRSLGEGERKVIVVELLNPLELASRETWIARPLSAVTPNLLRDLVYNKAASKVQTQMAALGVEVDVRTYRAR